MFFLFFLPLLFCVYSCYLSENTEEEMFNHQSICTRNLLEIRLMVF